MPIKEARAADVAAMQDSESLGLRVLVMRKWPRIRGFNKNVVDYWLPDAGPSLSLLESYRKNDIDWIEFAERYKEEQRSATSCRIVRYANGNNVSDYVLPIRPVVVIRGLQRELGTVSVICWEDTEHDEIKMCHRHLLVDLASSEVVHG